MIYFLSIVLLASNCLVEANQDDQVAFLNWKHEYNVEYADSNIESVEFTSALM